MSTGSIRRNSRVSTLRRADGNLDTQAECSQGDQVERRMVDVGFIRASRTWRYPI